ncbi:hypothetical protein [Pseudarthrobacter sp. NPDC080039]|uniref:hypothetical protein n=1 Tax=unclassified Pseudarthrobacter TaxID=2647000 RepID=UPI00344CE4A5
MTTLVGLTMLVLAGCGAGPDESVPGPAASMAASAGAGTPSASPLSDIPVAAAGGPSAAALMVCGEETRDNIVKILALPSPPGTSASWADKLYTCTYTLPAGALVLSVKEAPDPDTAHTYFQDLQRTTGGAAPIEGLANLGFPAFQTPASAVFVKDNFVLTVDAAALPETLGPNQVTRAAFAYQVASTVLACWSE